MKIRLTLFFLISLSFSSFAQRDEQISPLVYRTIPPSPNASALGKFGDIPVSNYTGIPSISIPFYTISTGDLNLKLSVDYHAGGIKVDEVASDVGLGWALSAGGMITRTVRGLPDDSQYGYLNNGVDIQQVIEADRPTITDYIDKVNKNLIDLQPDIYTYNFFGKSGKFLIDRSTRKGVLLNYGEKIDIEWTSSGAWVITDAAGTKYNFGGSAREFSTVFQDERAVPLTARFPSSWYLVSATDIKGNYINLNYTGYSTDYSSANEQTAYYIYYSDGNPCPLNDAKSLQRYEITGKKISSIEWKQGKVAFNYSSTGRTDISTDDNSLESVIVTSNINNNSLQVAKYNLSYDYFGISSSYAEAGFAPDGSTGRLLLKGIQQEGSSGNVIPPHSFYYEPGLPVRNSCSQDHWGFYNSAYNNTLIPKSYFFASYNNLLLLPGADRNPDLSSTMHGTLTKIVYPTGGSTELNYELNDAYAKDFDFEANNNMPYIDYAQVSKANMTRIPEDRSTFTVNGPINSVTGVAGAFVTIYVVINGSCDPSVRGGCSGNLYINPVSGTTGSGWVFGNLGSTPSTTYEVFLKNGSYDLVLEAENSIASLNIYKATVKGPDFSVITNSRYNKPIGGLRIKSIVNVDQVSGKRNTTNYKYRTEDNANISSGSLVSVPVYGYITGLGRGLTDGYMCQAYARTSSTKAPLSTTQGAFVGYKFVEVTKGEEGSTNNLGKSTFKYTSADEFSDQVNYRFPFPPSSSYDMQRGLLLENKEYKYENNQYSIVKFIKNSYTMRDLRFGVSQKGVVAGCSGRGQYGYCMEPQIGISTINSVWTWLHDQSIKDYSSDNSGAFTEKIVTYSYDNLLHLQPTQVLTTESGNKTKSEYTKYPADFADADATSEIISMKGEKHMHNYPVQKTLVLQDGAVSKVISSQIIQYGLNQNAILPQKNILLKSATPLLFNDPNSFPVYKPVNGYDPRKFELRSNYKYDLSGNIKEQAKTNDVVKSYQWGYNTSYPIAEVINAKSNEIYFDSFEEEGWDGLQNYTDAPIDEYDNTIFHSGRSSGKIVDLNAHEKYCHSNTKLQVSLTAPTKYKYSGWVYSDGPGVDIYLFMYRANETAYYSYVDYVRTNENYTTPTNQWIYMEKEVTVPADVTQIGIRVDNNGNNNGNGTVWFDDLRIYPSSAQMTSYTYDPLIGMTSQADVNNRFTFYEYDRLGRLGIVRDNDRNILKSYCYNYNGQVGSCGPIGNEALNLVFNKQCVNGSAVTYSIAANTYFGNTQQEANALAQADANQNGQAYANQKGFCNPNAIYTRLEKTEQSDYSDPYYTYQSSHYFLRHYYDQAGTHLTNLPVDVPYKWGYDYLWQSTYSYYPIFDTGLITGYAGTYETEWGWMNNIASYNDASGYYQYETATLSLLPADNYSIIP